jgi:hypothetical protein
MPTVRDKKPGGRPRLDPNDNSVQVCVSVPSRQYDDIYRRAQQDRVSVPEVIRRRLGDKNIQTSD